MPPRSPTTMHAIQSHCIKNPVFPYIPWISIDFLNIEHKDAAIPCIQPNSEFDLMRGNMIIITSGNEVSRYKTFVDKACSFNLSGHFVL